MIDVPYREPGELPPTLDERIESQRRLVENLSIMGLPYWDPSAAKEAMQQLADAQAELLRLLRLR